MRRCQNRVVHGVASALPLASALSTVLFVGMVMAAIVGVMALAARSDIYDEIGGGGLSMDHEEGSRRRRGAHPESGDQIAIELESQDPAIARAELELEVRQLVEAKSARAVRNGGEPLDVEREVQRLLARADEQDGEGARRSEQARERAERELEVRQMLEARSARSVRNGGQPLDVDAEVKRLLGDRV